jgi:ribosome biogenesis protein MAK21
MAKSNEKRSSGVQVSQTDKSPKADESKISSEENFISLDAGALANLTKKIEQNLKSGKGNNNNPQKRTENPKAEIKKGPKKNFTEKKGAAQKTNQGKKRNRNGDVIDKPEKDGKAQTETEDDILRKEILALGGSKEDFDLLANVNSDSEVEESASKKAGSEEDSLRKELSKLLKDVGQYNPEIPDDQVTDEEESMGESEGDDEEAEEQLQQSAKVDDKKKKDAVTETQSQFPKEYSRLVSYSASAADFNGKSLIRL